MAVFRIQVTLADGGKAKYTGLFVDSKEAVDQTLADYPDARAVSVLFIYRRPA